MKLTGIAAPFNSRSVNLGGFVEVIAPGAFARTLRQADQFAVHHHDFANLLGSTRSRTLTLSEETQGLRFTLNLPDTGLGRDVHALVKRGDLAHMSFSFLIPQASGETWRELGDGTLERTLLDIDLFEISTVAAPAYRDSKVSARADQQATAIRNRMRRRMMETRYTTAVRLEAA